MLHFNTRGTKRLLACTMELFRNLKGHSRSAWSATLPCVLFLYAQMFLHGSTTHADVCFLSIFSWLLNLGQPRQTVEWILLSSTALRGTQVSAVQLTKHWGHHVRWTHKWWRHLKAEYNIRSLKTDHLLWWELTLKLSAIYFSCGIHIILINV